MRRASHRHQSVPTAIIDASALCRAGLTHILSGTRFRIIAGCSRLDEIPPNALNGHHCLVLISLDEDALAVLSRVRSLKAQNQYLRVVTLSDRFDPEEFLTTIEFGCDGYLLKNQISPDALLKSMELVLLGEAIMPQGFAHLIRGKARPQLEALSNGKRPETGLEYTPALLPFEAPQSDDIVRLSNRERTILWQLTQGASNKHIARELEIAEATVKVHVKSLLRKIRVSNRTQAAMWAINHLRPALDRQSRSGSVQNHGAGFEGPAHADLQNFQNSPRPQDRISDAAREIGAFPAIIGRGAAP
jgi:two-component system nitrate/nitrite response regulator NarL